MVPNEHLRNLALDFSTWEKYRIRENFSADGKIVPGLTQYCYQKEIDGVVISAGSFEYAGKPTHIAWGVKAEPHCSFHTIYTPSGWSAPIEGCPVYVLPKDGARSGFSLKIEGALCTFPSSHV